jgi:hypothetical protein
VLREIEALGPVERFPGGQHSYDAGSESSRIDRGEQPSRVTSPISGSLHGTSARVCDERPHAYGIPDRSRRSEYRSAGMMLVRLFCSV